MSATLTEITIAMIAGVVGGISIGRVASEHSLGTWLNALFGGAGALIGALFLKDQVLLMVTMAGTAQAGSSATNAALLMFAAAIEGAISVLLGGLVRTILLEKSRS